MDRIGVVTCITMEDDLFLSTKRAYGFEGLQCSDFVVNRHDTNQYGIVANCSFQFIHIHSPSRLLHGKVRNIISFHFQGSARVQNALVFCLRRDYMFSSLFVKVGCAFNGKIVTLGCATGEDNFFGLSSNQVRNLLSCSFYSRFCLPSKRMGTTVWIAIRTNLQKNE